MSNVPLTIDDLMAQNKGRRLYRITITSSKTNGVFWNYDEYCLDLTDAIDQGYKLVEKSHSDPGSSWHRHVTEVQGLGRVSDGYVKSLAVQG